MYNNNMRKLINVLKSKKKILIIGLYVLIFIIYILKPLCFDVKIYLEAAMRADGLGNFPSNIINAWEHKFILNRILFYIIFKITKLIVSVNNIILFEMVVKLIYGITCITIIKYFVNNTKVFWSKQQIEEDIVFGILYLFTIGSGTYFLLQTEMTALLIVLLAIVFALKDKLIYQILCAFTISMLFWLKGVTLLYSIIVLVVMLLNNNKKKKIIFIIVLSCMFLILELVLLCYFEPDEINNMYLSTQYINTSITFKSIIKFFMKCILSYPFFNIGLIAFVINVVHHINNKSIKLLILETFTWVILLIGVCIQKMQYFYQIGLMCPAIILSVLIWLKNMNVKWPKVLFIFLMLCSMLLEMPWDIRIYLETAKSSEKIVSLNERIPDLKDGEILYIGNGLSNYYIKAKSYTNYVTTIFLNNNNQKYLNNSYINDLKDKIKKYTGKYIVVDEIELSEKFRISDDIIKFIEENYHYKQSTEISICEIGVGECAAIYERNKE